MTRQTSRNFGLGRGLLSFGIYTLLWGSIAWARFSTADVTS